MKVLLAGPDYEENLSLRYLSGSLLSAGHETLLAAFNAAPEIGAVANAAQDVDLVGLSICFQARAKEFLALAREIKSRDPKKLVVAGGHYASCAAGAVSAPLRSSSGERTATMAFPLRRGSTTSG